MMMKFQQWRENKIFSDEFDQNLTNQNTMFDSQNTTQQNKKTFVFQNQSTNHSSLAYHKIKTDAPFTDIKPILDHYCPIQKNKIQIFNTLQNRFTPLENLNPNNPLLIPTQYLEYGFVMFRYRNQTFKQEIQSIHDQNMDQSSSNLNNKKDRSKQRTIGQVIDVVKKWRKLHNTNQGKKLNLQQAAKIVGVSKKSLDDYYYQLRIGQQFDYDFQNHLNDKIGDLRSFVKSRKPQKILKNRNSKHPKRLKIIEEDADYYEISEQELRQSPNIYVPPQSPFLKGLQNQIQVFQQSSSLGLDKNLQIIANNYYDNFQNLLDQDHDPYFFVGDFIKKESFSFGSDSDILF